MNKAELEKKILKIIDVFDNISKKPIFICTEQQVVSGNEKFTLPKCEYVKISFKDYNKLYEVIKRK